MSAQRHVKRVLKVCSNKQKGHFKKGNDMLGREWGCHLNTIVINLYTVVVFSLFLCVIPPFFSSPEPKAHR